MINLARDLFISLPRVELNRESPFQNRCDPEIKSDPKIRFDTKMESEFKISFGTKIKSGPKFGFHTKIKSGSKIGFMLKSACIQNFELILYILDYLKPSISSLKLSCMFHHSCRYILASWQPAFWKILHCA